MQKEDLQKLSKEQLIELIENKVIKSGEFFFNNPVTTFVANSLYEFDVPVLITDNNVIDPIIVYCNIGFQKVSGYSKKELIGQSPRILQGELTERNVLDSLKKSLIEGSHFRGSTANYRKDGSIFYNQWGIEPIKNTKGEITHFISMHADVTELKKIEQELQYQIDQKNTFFSIIAHDLRNPLTGFMTLTQLVRDKAGDFSFNKLTQYIEQLNEASKGLNELLSNLLIWSRTQTNNFEVNKFNFKSKEKVLNILNLFKSQSESKKINIKLNINDNEEVNSDPFIFDTIIRNLLSNAIKFTPENGNIIFQSKVDDKFYYIDVIDSGIGIKEDVIDKLFDISKKVTTLGTNREKGTGLGLKLCKELALKQDCDLLVKSEVNKGTTFTIKFPIDSK